MSTGSLHDRLQRLRRPAEARRTAAGDGPGGPSGIEGLERERLGEVVLPGGESLSLKARLERLVAATVRGERRRTPAPAPLEELVDGMRVENERGEFFLGESSVHLERRQGDVPLTRLRTLDPGTVAILTAEAEMAGFDLREAVFLDTETTGLAGGTGTAAFLIGVGWVDGERFHVRQYFMRDYHEEAALLHALAQELSRFTRFVTFNGKMFDVPLLEARFRLNRARFPLADLPHLDLLHPARRLWKARLPSCRLQALETELLGLRRVGDIAGEDIPQVYFDWVRRRDARMLSRVFEHNRQDIISLAALAVHACRWVEEGWAEHPRDVFSLARVLERARLFARCEEEYRRVLTLDAGPLRAAALLRLAWRAKRAGDWERAAALWAEAGEAGEPEGFRELAMHHEHRTRDLDKALAAAERGQGLVDEGRDLRSRHFSEGFRRRRERLQRKKSRLSRSRAGGTRPGPGSGPAS